jgi:TrmH family RNA methyltransferase
VERLLGLLTSTSPPPYTLRVVLVADSYRERFEAFDGPARCHHLGVEAYAVGERTIDQLADTDSPQGVMAVVEAPDEARDLAPRALALARRKTLRIVLAEGVSDPGNLGTLARTAAAMGAHLFLAHGGADPFGPKAVRASAGEFLALPYGEVREPERLLKALSRHGVSILASVASGGRDPSGFWPPARWVLILGSEAHGLPGAWTRHADWKLTIPLRRNVESLNVAVAGSILLHALSEPPHEPRPRGRRG